MAFLLQEVVPWGRSLEEYRHMFSLTDDELLTKSIISFGDGPADFNGQVTRLGGSVLSVDPIYSFTASELKERIDEVRGVVMEQMKANLHRYKWDKIKDLSELEALRMGAMNNFLKDFEKGKEQGRYLCHSLPKRLPFDDKAFDLGISSHFLLLYDDLGIDFHIKAIAEMLRLCKEVRIFPTVNLSGDKTELCRRTADYFGEKYSVEFKKTDYEFQLGACEMLVIA